MNGVNGYLHQKSGKRILRDELPDMLNQTIEDAIKAILPGGLTPKTLLWPPDVFALAGFLLQVSGAYSQSVGDMQVGKLQPEKLVNAGAEWRASFNNKPAIPKLVSQNAKVLQRFGKIDVEEISGNHKLVSSLLDLLGAADEACQGIAFPLKSDGSSTDEFHIQVIGLLAKQGHTLCKTVNASVACVLPKVHTPQNGITLRSLSHYLAFLPMSEVKAAWQPLQGHMGIREAKTHQLNLLIIPYPHSIDPSDFLASKCRTSGRRTLPADFGFFHYAAAKDDRWLKDELPGLLKKIEDGGTRIDGVILPEASLRDEDQFAEVDKAVKNRFPSAFLLAGVYSGHPVQAGSNKLQYSFRVGADTCCLFEQKKHHRWKLNAEQIRQYEMNSLDRGTVWWEHIEIGRRKLQFFSVKSSLTCCFLICEDLARQEPVSPIVRAVGPHLVVALLQDGPQLKTRWSSRYASILTDDPGSAVLTLTSLGMVLCSRDSKGKKPDPNECVVASWRDRENSEAITIKKTDRAVLLKLRSQRRTEFSSDGRANSNVSELIFDGAEPIA